MLRSKWTKHPRRHRQLKLGFWIADLILLKSDEVEDGE